MNLTIKNFDKLFSKGVENYEKLKYDEAIVIFRALASQYPTEKNIWIFLAHSLQAKREYSLALKSWAMAALLSQHDPYPPYFAAECYFHLNNPIEGAKALENAEKNIHEKNHPLIEKIHSLKSTWNFL